jgi:hypothetical protein
MKLTSLSSYFLICFYFLITVQLRGQCTTNVNNGSWTNTGTWTGCGGGVPISSSNVVIANSTTTLTLTANLTIANLTINANQTLTVTGGFRLIITGNLTMNNQSDFLISGGAFIEVRGDFNSANNGNVSVDGAGTGGSFLIRGCYRVGGGQPDPNVFGGVGITWCVNGSCTSGNNSESGTNACNTLLPVTLVSLSSRLTHVQDSFRENGNVVEIFWTTTNEVNNSFYTVEKSPNGTDFQEVTRIKGAGTSNALNHYKAYDYNPYEGITYYRLKQTDYDGTFTYSKLIQLETFTNLTIYPNPIYSKDKQLTVHIQQSIYNELKVKIIDASGKMIHESTFERKEGNVFQLSLPNEIAQGIYFVHLQTEQNRIVRKLIIL